MQEHTDANKSLTTLVVKHYNDLFGSQTSERGRDEVIRRQIDIKKKNKKS